MEHQKPWYLSRTIWASIIAIGAAGGGIFGVAIDETAASALTDGVLQAIGAVASIVAILGRLSATTRIG